MSEIERCPFCGKQPDLVSRAGAAGYRCSGKEPEHFVHSYGATEDEALAAWNTRSQPERVSRLEEALKEIVAATHERKDLTSRLVNKIAFAALNQGADDGR